MRNKAAAEKLKAKKLAWLQAEKQKTLEEGRKPVSAAIQQAIVGHSYKHKYKHSHFRLPSHAFWSTVVNNQLKSKEMPPISSHFCKFLGVANPSNSDTSKLVSNFIKLFNRQNPGTIKGDDFKKQFQILLNREQGVGIREFTKILSN